ncbi:MAG: N-acetylglucosamine-6-phosphate deacetylase [Anaerolineae bacterium]|nr:N-acetylglucosamine-6-phosphate deacetylase [Anaerolineae bacterium]
MQANVNSNQSTLVKCGQLVLADRVERDTNLLLHNGKIADIALHLDPPTDAEIIDASDDIVAPGFIDIHVHGGNGADTMDATAAAFDTMSAFYAAHGVTGWLATTITADKSDIDATVLTAKGFICQQQQALPANRPPQAALLGVHLEGPYLNAKWCGAQDKSYIRAANSAEYETWFASGVVKLITVAPEVTPENAALLDYAVAHGAAVALGHTDCSYEQAKAFFARGANQSTHTFNAMRGLHHRDPGLVGAVMDQPVYAQLIADGVHVHPAAIRALFASKGPARLAVITDAMRAAGLADGSYGMGEQIVTVKDHIARMANGTLAGSLLTMDVGFRNIRNFTGCTLSEASLMCSHTPAMSIGMGHRKGKIDLGYDADLVILDQHLQVKQIVKR